MIERHERKNEKMRAVRLHGQEDIRVEDIPTPAAGDDEVMLKVATVCVCGSDLHYYLQGQLGTNKIKQPHIPGHEFSARVCDDRAEEKGFRNGQLVAVEPARTCGHCEHCLDGRPNLCPDMEFSGTPPVHGGMSEYFVARPHDIIPVPEGFTPAQAAALEPVGVGIHAMKKTDLQIAESVAVLGCGPIGLIMVQLVRAAGAGQIIAVDPIGYRTAKARSLGADHVAQSHEAVAELTDGRGVDLVIEATNSPEAFGHACQIARLAGRIVLIGIPSGTDYAPMDAKTFRMKELSVKICNRMGRVYPDAIEAVRRGLVDVDTLMTHRGGLDDAPAIFARQGACEDGSLKSLVFPNGEDA